MALIHCKECDNEVSTKAKTCPRCGASVPKRPWGIICAGVFGGLIAIGALSGNQNSPASNSSHASAPVAPINCNIFSDIEKPHTTSARFEVKIGTTTQGDPRKPTVVGRTNLPVGTDLMISLERPQSAYEAEAKAKVDKQGCFKGGPFTDGNDPINTGTYTIDVVMPVLQSASVNAVIGRKGQHISGPLVHRFENLGKTAESKSPYTVGQPDAVKDAQAKQKDQSDRQARQQELRSRLVVLVARTLKENLRNPATADWVSVLANDDASVVCIVLRAQNGFGGMSVDNYAVVDGTISERATVWNRRCAGQPMNDMTTVVRWTV